MGFWDWFKIKKAKIAIYQPHNRLEELMQRAALDPAVRPEFYRQLFHFELIVLGTVIEDENKEQVAQFVTFRDGGPDYVFAFTSEQALRHLVEHRILNEQPFVGIPSTALFQMLATEKQGVVLNSSLEFSKTFTPLEVSNLLSGGEAYSSNEIIDKGSRVKIGPLANVPEDVIKMLAGYINNEPKVNNLYIALQQVEENDPEVVIIIEYVDNISETGQQRINTDLLRLVAELELPFSIILVPLTEDYARAIKPAKLINVLEESDKN